MKSLKPMAATYTKKNVLSMSLWNKNIKMWEQLSNKFNSFNSTQIIIFNSKLIINIALTLIKVNDMT